MAQTALIQVRVDAELKKEAEALFNGMGWIPLRRFVFFLNRQ
jgi:antitoxin component of RelBE/YafQ-DinJ toxin-antitoxin module